MAYKVIILYQLYMPSYFLGTFTEYPYLSSIKSSAGVSGVGNPTAFQFYLSSIKSGSGQGSVDFSSEFQFYLSSIKSYENVS